MPTWQLLAAFSTAPQFTHSNKKNLKKPFAPPPYRRFSASLRPMTSESHAIADNQRFPYPFETCRRATKSCEDLFFCVEAPVFWSKTGQPTTVAKKGSREFFIREIRSGRSSKRRETRWKTPDKTSVRVFSFISLHRQHAPKKTSAVCFT